MILIDKGNQKQKNNPPIIDEVGIRVIEDGVENICELIKVVDAVITSDNEDVINVVLNGVGDLVELVCILDDEEIISELDDAILEDEGDGAVLDGVGEFGELVCKLDGEDIISELDDGDGERSVLDGISKFVELVRKDEVIIVDAKISVVAIGDMHVWLSNRVYPALHSHVKFEVSPGVGIHWVDELSQSSKPASQ